MTSATSIMVRRPRAVWDRTAPDSRLLPISFPNIVFLLNTPSGDGRSIDSNRLAFIHSQHPLTGAPLGGCTYLTGKVNAGQAEEPGYFRLRAIEPAQVPLLVTIRDLIHSHEGFESMLHPLRIVERNWWTGQPHIETFSCLVLLLKTPRGSSREVVDATGSGADVAASLPKNPGPSIAFSSAPSPVEASLVGAFPANLPLSPRTRKDTAYSPNPSHRLTHLNNPTHRGRDPVLTWPRTLPPRPTYGMATTLPGKPGNP